MGKAAMRSPIKWLGGKGKMASKLMALVPRHHIYVEPFGGGASMLFAKAPSPVEVYNDIDSGLVNFFRVLRDPETFGQLQRMVELTPHSKEEYYTSLREWEATADPVERAYRWFVVARQSFGGHFGASWGYSLTESISGMSKDTATWLSAIQLLPEVSARLLRVQVDNSDWQAVLDRYDGPSTFFYCDPPYVTDTRKGGEYRHELTDGMHAQLVQRLLSLKGKAMLSGYGHPIYQPLEDAGWVRMDFETVCHVAGRTRNSKLQGAGNVVTQQKRIESVWLHPGAVQWDAVPAFLEGEA